jgi:GrpB-like predicted nucleotidyltransferase (UPF0157 family)
MPRDELDRYLEGVLVGGPERRPIVIADHDPGWAVRFEHERARIQDALPGVAQRVEHIGSTSVPGLAAKPIVDILLTVADPEDEASFAPALERAGYVLRLREPGHRMLRTAAVDVQVHVLAQGDPEADRYVLFRDRLRAGAEDRVAYERLKRALARRYVDDVNRYADAKSAFVEAVIARAGGPARRFP